VRVDPHEADRGAAPRAIAAEVEARHGVRVSHMTVKAAPADDGRAAAA
jgi:hypothetical protein